MHHTRLYYITSLLKPRNSLNLSNYFLNIYCSSERSTIEPTVNESNFEKHNSQRFLNRSFRSILWSLCTQSSQKISFDPPNYWLFLVNMSRTPDVANSLSVSYDSLKRSNSNECFIHKSDICCLFHESRRELGWMTRFSVNHDSDVSLFLHKTFQWLQKTWKIVHYSHKPILWESFLKLDSISSCLI